jgi:hypothetical protein
MTIADDAIVMAYDFDDRDAFMMFEADANLDIRQVTDYWDDATDGQIRTIIIYVGEIRTALRRNDNGEWMTTLGAMNGVG